MARESLGLAVRTGGRPLRPEHWALMAGPLGTPFLIGRAVGVDDPEAGVYDGAPFRRRVTGPGATSDLRVTRATETPP